MEPRRASTEEKKELVAYCLRSYYHEASSDDATQQESFVDSAAIAVFDQYITDGPGYAGKLMTVVWSGSPSFYTVLIWTDGILHEVEQGS